MKTDPKSCALCVFWQGMAGDSKAVCDKINLETDPEDWCTGFRPGKAGSSVEEKQQSLASEVHKIITGLQSAGWRLDEIGAACHVNKATVCRWKNDGGHIKTAHYWRLSALVGAADGLR